MPQNRETGAAANQFGKAAAKIIAALIGAKSISKTSNEVYLCQEKGGYQIRSSWE